MSQIDNPPVSRGRIDIIDIARYWDSEGEIDPPFSIPVAELDRTLPAETGHRTGKAYLRFIVKDRPGVLAEITAGMRDAGVSIESLIQMGSEYTGGEDGSVLVSMVTHEGEEAAVEKALDLLAGLEFMTAPPLVMHILRQ